ncbi:MAG: type II toxin-antitoxin system VapC family toxin [Gammaproteobacteria bacterium]
MFYVDTSVVLAFYRAEAQSDRAQRFLRGLKEPALISNLTEIEVASALGRWVRMEEISDADASRIHAAFESDIEQQYYRRVPLTTAHYRQATLWLLTRRTALRALDALHLACAARLQIQLATFDTSLSSAAATFGIGVHRL